MSVIKENVGEKRHYFAGQAASEGSESGDASSSKPEKALKTMVAIKIKMCRQSLTQSIASMRRRGSPTEK